MASFGERVVGAMKLDANTFEEIERDPTAIAQSAGIIALSAVSVGLGNLYRGGISGIVFQVCVALIGYLVWTVIVWVVGTKLMPDPATKADFAETFRVIGFAASPGIVGVVAIVPSVIPVLGWLLVVMIGLLISLWQIAAMVIAVRQVLDYTSTGKAALVVVIGFVVNFIVSMMLGLMFLGTAMMRGALS